MWCYLIIAVCTYRLILIAEAETVYNEFATPLINRLEKHFVLASSILEEWQIEVLNRLEAWINKFSSVRWVNFRGIYYSVIVVLCIIFHYYVMHGQLLSVCHCTGVESLDVRMLL